jgi:hypothetical protein
MYEIIKCLKIESCVLSQIKELRYKKTDFYEINLKLLNNLTKDCLEI